MQQPMSMFTAKFLPHPQASRWAHGYLMLAVPQRPTDSQKSFPGGQAIEATHSLHSLGSAQFDGGQLA